MADFFQDTKNKIQDLFIYIVSCGKSSKEPSRNDQELARDVPLGDDSGLLIYIPEEDQVGAATNIPPGKSSKEPPTNIAQGQGHIVVIQPGNNTQNQEAENIIAQQEGQGLDESIGNSQEGQLLIIERGNNTQNQEEENIIAQQQGQVLDESTRNSQEQKQKQAKENNDDDDFEPLPEGFIPEERANFSKPPGKRSAPKPKTG